MEGGIGGECKATGGHGPLGHDNATATPPSLLPQPNLGHHDSGTWGGQARLSGWLAQTGDEVKRLQGQPHEQLRAAKEPQWEYGQGVAGTPQEHQGWVKRLQEWPRVPRKWAQVAFEPQEMQVVAQPPEAKVSGVANPLPQVAELLQLWVGGLAWPPLDVLVQRMPPNLPAGHVLTAWQPPLPPLRWPHLFLGGLPPLPILPPRAGKPAICLSQPGAATLPVWRALYPRPSS